MLDFPSAAAANTPYLYNLTLKELSNIRVQSVDFFETSLSRSPNNITVITHDQIDQLPALQLSDFVELYVPGAHLAKNSIRGHQFGVRGITRGGSAKTLVMWDGHSLDQRNNWGNMSVYSSPLLGDLEQIEIVLGPGSIVHGTGALNGYVNFVPKSGADHPGLHSTIDFGLQDDLLRAQLGYGASYGDERDFYIYGGFVQASGIPFRSDFGGATGRVRSVRNALLENEGDLVLEYEPSYKLSTNWTHDQFNLKLLYEHMEVDTNDPVLVRKPFNQKSLLSIQPRYTHSLGTTDSIEIAPSLTWFDKSRVRKGRTPSVPSDEGGGSESMIELKTTYQTGRFAKQKIAAGFVFTHRDSRGGRHFFSSDPTVNDTHVDGNWNEFAVFAENRIELDDRTSLTLGLRHDWAEFDHLQSQINRFPNITFEPDDISNLSVRAALTHELNDRHTLRLSYQEGFLYPQLSAYPRAAAVNEALERTGFEPFQSLRPESVNSVEFGLNSQLMDSTVTTRLTLYYNYYRDLIGFRDIRVGPNVVPPEALAEIPVNVAGLSLNSQDDFASVGGELSAAWDVTPHLRATFGYAYSVPSGLSEQANLELAVANEERSEWSVYPKHQANAGIEYQDDKWFIALSAVYESEVDTDDTLGGRPIFDDDYTRVNAVIQYRFHPNLTAVLLGKNLFKDNTPPLNATPSQPWAGNLGSDTRLFYLGIRWQPR